jgi:predicted secreted protein
MAKIDLGVFPVNENEAFVGTAGYGAEAQTWAEVAQMETISISIDTGVEEWNPMEMHGWRDAMATAKSLEIELTGKRCIGDAGNDYLASKKFALGTAAYVPFKYVMPDGEVLILSKNVAQVESLGGDTTGVQGLSVKLISACVPTFEEAEQA